MTQERGTPVFNPEVPADLEHAQQIRGEAFDWLENHYPGVFSFTTGEVLLMVRERERRWLIARLRARGIGNEEPFSVPTTADALAVLFLRSRGVRFREAADAVLTGEKPAGGAEPRYGGVWNRLIDIALKRLGRRLTARLLGAAVFSLLRDPNDHPNCLIIVKRHGRGDGAEPRDEAGGIDHDHVYRTILERPTPSCWVLSPFREVLYMDRDQLPTRAEVTARHFVGLQVQTEREVYELMLGTMGPSVGISRQRDPEVRRTDSRYRIPGLRGVSPDPGGFEARGRLHAGTQQLRRSPAVADNPVPPIYLLRVAVRN